MVTTRRAVPCSRRRVGAARPRGSSPSRAISLEEPVIRSHVQVRRSGASAPPLTVSARAGGTLCGGLLGPITQSAASGGGYSQHMQTLVTAPKRSKRMSLPHPTLYRRLSRAQYLGLARTLKPISLLGHNPNTARITSDQCPWIRPRRFLPLSVRPLRFKPAWSQFGSHPDYMASSGL